MKINVEITMDFSDKVNCHLTIDRVQNLISEFYYISGVKEVKTEYKDEESKDV